MRAVIIGASIAGLLAARPLSDFADSVTLVDRDVPLDSPVPRKGVPQGRHVHGVLAGGMRALQHCYFRGVSSIVKAAWAMVTGADMVYPQAEGQRPFGQGAALRYLGHIQALSCYDAKILTVWNQVTNMQRPLSSLFAPSIAARVLRRAVAGGPPPLSSERP